LCDFVKKIFAVENAQQGNDTCIILVTVMSENLQIDTPENVVFGYKVAGIGSRFMAALVDSLLIAILEVLVYLLMLLVITKFMEAQWTSWLIAIYSLIAFLFLWGFYIFFELLWNGQSPGKRWVGLRVVRTDGMPITLVESLVRNLIRLLDFMPIAYGVGVVTMFINSQSRRLGDLAAGTLVVYDHLKDDMPLLPVPEASLPLNWRNAQPPADLPVSRLTNQDILLAEEYFRRREGIVHNDMLAVQIAASLYKKMGIADLPVDRNGAEKALAEILVAVHQPKPG